MFGLWFSLDRHVEGQPVIGTDGSHDSCTQADPADKEQDAAALLRAHLVNDLDKARQRREVSEAHLTRDIFNTSRKPETGLGLALKTGSDKVMLLGFFELTPTSRCFKPSGQSSAKPTLPQT